MSGLQIVKRQYAGHWPIWCVVDDGRVILCRETERRAGEMLAAMDKAKGTRGNIQEVTGGNIVAPPEAAPTLSEIGITKRQSSDWQNERGAVMRILIGQICTLLTCHHCACTFQ